jgi:predicted Rossmann fold nucleotide-binding protein DprA/Smf involved in DNA uptake
MNLLLYASTLWQKTHLIQRNDLEIIHQQAIQTPDAWQRALTNLKLKEYLSFQPHWMREAEKEIDSLEKGRISFLHCLDEKYPKQFQGMSFPPLFFSYMGNLECLRKPCISVVGSRDPSQDATYWLEKYFYRTLKHHDLTVVSGAANGIDQYAHQIATICQRSTIAVIPAGLQYILILLNHK